MSVANTFWGYPPTVQTLRKFDNISMLLTINRTNSKVICIKITISTLICT